MIVLTASENASRLEEIATECRVMLQTFRPGKVQSMDECIPNLEAAGCWTRRAEPLSRGGSGISELYPAGRQAAPRSLAVSGHRGRRAPSRRRCCASPISLRSVSIFATPNKPMPSPTGPLVQKESLTCTRFIPVRCYGSRKNFKVMHGAQKIFNI